MGNVRGSREIKADVDMGRDIWLPKLHETMALAILFVDVKNSGSILFSRLEEEQKARAWRKPCY